MGILRKSLHIAGELISAETNIPQHPVVEDVEPRARGGAPAPGHEERKPPENGPMTGPILDLGNASVSMIRAHHFVFLSGIRLPPTACWRDERKVGSADFRGAGMRVRRQEQRPFGRRPTGSPPR